MPILTALVNQPHTSEEKGRFLEAATQAVMDSLGAPINSVRVSLHITDAQDVMVAGTRGAPLALVTAYLLPGRTEQQKGDLIAALSTAVENVLGISNQDSRIVIVDTPLTDMGVAGGISAKAAGR